jgi:beta-glucuronidase
LDEHRLISAALHGTIDIRPNVKSIEDELIQVLDVVGLNQYYGWFSGTPETLDDITWEFEFQKPLIMTEFGASSPYGRHRDKTEKYSEGNQAFYYEKTIQMIKRIPNLSGTCPWNLVEHRSPLRVMSGIEDGFSRAGLISVKGQRKKAFYVMKQYYDELIEEKIIPD